MDIWRELGIEATIEHVSAMLDHDHEVTMHVVREIGLEIPHRVVGDRRQVHHAVVTLEVSLIERAHVLCELAVRRRIRFPLAALEEPEIAAGHGVSGLLQQVDQVEQRCYEDHH